MSRGIITREFTVWCGLCEKWEQTSDAETKGAMARWARAAGWTLTKASGWVCRRHTGREPGHGE